MNFLKFVIIGAVGFSLISIQGEDPVFDHETLKTADGKVYHEIAVLGSDLTGLTFRHREGIAKVDFTALSEAYRMLYEGVEDLPEETEDAAAVEEKSGEGGLIARLEEGPVQLEARNRVVIAISHPYWQIGGGIDHDWRDPAWPVWWPDHARVHRLTHPLYRELALRDFLLTSRLLPFPGHR